MLGRVIISFTFCGSYVLPWVMHLYTGRLYQVEYAMEAISQAGSAVGILAQNGTAQCVHVCLGNVFFVVFSLTVHT